jgi:hypothetical protein
MPQRALGKAATVAKRPPPRGSAASFYSKANTFERLVVPYIMPLFWKVNGITYQGDDLQKSQSAFKKLGPKK